MGQGQVSLHCDLGRAARFSRAMREVMAMPGPLKQGVASVRRTCSSAVWKVGWKCGGGVVSKAMLVGPVES